MIMKGLLVAVTSALMLLSASLVVSDIEAVSTPAQAQPESATATPWSEPEQGPPDCSTPPPWTNFEQALACETLYPTQRVPGCAAPADAGPSMAGVWERWFCSGFMPTPGQPQTPTPGGYPVPAYP